MPSDRIRAKRQPIRKVTLKINLLPNANGLSKIILSPSCKVNLEVNLFPGAKVTLLCPAVLALANIVQRPQVLLIVCPRDAKRRLVAQTKQTKQWGNHSLAKRG